MRLSAEERELLTNSIDKYLQRHDFEVFAPKAVLFDMDGVLIDSMPNHAVAWQQSMAEFGIRMSAADAYATEGQRGIDTIRIMVKEQQGRSIGEAEAQRMYDVKTRLFHQMPRARVFPGVRSLMKKLKRYGFRIVVVTGSGQRPLIKRLTEDFEGFVTEDMIVTAYDVKRGKPAPDPFLMGLQKAGNLQPWEAVVVENAPLGIRAGVAADIFTFAVNSGPLPDKALSQAGADIVFPDINHITRAIDVLFRMAPTNEGRFRNQNNLWHTKCNQIIEYMETYKRRPSKHRQQDHQMLNWLKYNRKRYVRGLLSERQTAAFNQLLKVADQYQRLNQYSYGKASFDQTGKASPEKASEASLF